MNNKELSNKLDTTLLNSDLTKFTADIAEAILDNSFLEDGILKEIPVISSIIGINKSINSIQDYLFNLSSTKRREIIG